MIASIAWKNVWRNRTRSMTVISAVAVGVFAGVFAIAAMNSSVVQRIEEAVNLELSHVQINTRDFRSNGNLNNVLPQSDSLAGRLQTFPGVKEVTGRILVNGIASTANKSSGVVIHGIDVEKEKKMFSLHQKVIPGTGSYFETTTRLNSALVGEKLAKELRIIRYILTPEQLAAYGKVEFPESLVSKVVPLLGRRFVTEKKLSEALDSLLTPKEIRKYGYALREAAWSFREGSRIILSFLDVNDIQTSAAFRICGVFRTNNDMFEASSVFVPDGELRQLTGLKEGTYHRLICRMEKDDLADTTVPAIRRAFSSLEVLSWKEIQPDLAMLSDMMQQIYGVFMAIILAALAFGIVNTMLMAVLERTKELGMLAAIGMNRRKTFLMIMLASVYLSVSGGAAGMVISGIVIAATAKNGINLVTYAEGMEAMGFSAHLYPSIDLPFFIMTSLLIILTGVFSAIYPARKALRLNPLEAIRTD
jgi:ABC-type lipoprotein release transport system permease subunit